jgi:hypothetical protein
MFAEITGDSTLQMQARNKAEGEGAQYENSDRQGGKNPLASQPECHFSLLHSHFGMVIASSTFHASAC